MQMSASPLNYNSNHMNRILMHCLPAVLLLAASCSPLEKGNIHGEWKGIEATEEGVPIGVDPGLIRMSFGDKGYTYQSTLNYREAGAYYIDSKYLYTTDTLNQASTEKAVEIVQLGPDTLILKMMEGERERLLTLKKVN